LRHRTGKVFRVVERRQQILRADLAAQISEHANRAQGQQDTDDGDPPEQEARLAGGRGRRRGYANRRRAARRGVAHARSRRASRTPISCRKAAASSAQAEASARLAAASLSLAGSRRAENREIHGRLGKGCAGISIFLFIL